MVYIYLFKFTYFVRVCFGNVHDFHHKDYNIKSTQKGDLTLYLLYILEDYSTKFKVFYFRDIFFEISHSYSIISHIIFTKPGRLVDTIWTS